MPLLLPLCELALSIDNVPQAYLGLTLKLVLRLY